MKKLILLTAVLLMALPASAETLNFQVTDTLSINAQAPDAPAALPTIRTTPHAFDEDQVVKLFLKSPAPREETEFGPIYRANSNAYAEFLAVNHVVGDVCYQSGYYDNYLEYVLRFRNEMSDWSNLFPQDLELSGFPKADAVQKAREMLEGLGVVLLPGERVYTLEKNSFARFQADLAQSEEQVYMPKHVLDPFDPAHEGYYIVFHRELNGLPVSNTVGDGSAVVLLTRQGWEYVRTGYVRDAASESGVSPVLSARQALLGVADQLEMDYSYSSDPYGESSEREDPAVIERVQLVYEEENAGNDRLGASDTFIPIWQFTFQRTQWGGGSWRERTINQTAFLLVIFVDARTGRLMWEEQC